MRISKLRATTAEWMSAYPWHYGRSIPSTGPILGVDLLAGGAPFGLDVFELVRQGVAQNPNLVVVGAPANGKSALVKQMLWWMAGAFGLRFAATDVKGEYAPLAGALGVPVVALHPGGEVSVNPLADPAGRLEFASALAALCVDRPLAPVEAMALAAAVKVLPERPLHRHLLGVLREMPAAVCDELVMTRSQALEATQVLRFGIGELLTGVHAGMFDGHTNVDSTAMKRGFVIDLSGCGSDDRALRLAMLAGMRAVEQLVSRHDGPTLVVNDESWRLVTNLDTARWMQHSFKLGRQRGQATMLVLHRLSDLGAQTDGAAAHIGNRLVGDADIRILFRHGDLNDAHDTVTRLGLHEQLADRLATLPAYQAIVEVRGRYALLGVRLSGRVTALADTNERLRAWI